MHCVKNIKIVVKINNLNLLTVVILGNNFL